MNQATTIIQQAADVLLPLGKHALALLLQAIAAALVSSPVWGPVLLKVGGPIARALFLQATNAQTAAAFAALENAVKPAVNVAFLILSEAMRKARQADSPGGATVTAEEYQAAVAEAVRAAWTQLDKAGTIRAIVAAYGGEDEVKRSLQVLMQRALSSKHGIDAPAGG